MSIASQSFLALTLRERLANLTRWQSDFKYDSDLANLRLKDWTDGPPFFNLHLLEQHLALDGIELERFKYILGESLDALSDRIGQFPYWVKRLESVISESSFGVSLPGSKLNRSDNDFDGFLSPFLASARKQMEPRIREILSGRSVSKLAGQITEVFIEDFSAQLRFMTKGALVLELNVARELGQFERLSPEEGYEKFVESLTSRNTIEALLQQYPVLARQLVSRIEQACDSASELLRRLEDDRESITEMLNDGQDIGELVRVQSGLGDFHAGRRSVTLLAFTSGLQVIYKPRSISVDKHFQEMLSWVNSRDLKHQFQVVTVVDKQKWGWMEFVSGESCKSKAEIEQFYWRAGGLLAVLFLLNGTDIHYENIIAHGPHPVLIDLESLFHGSPYETVQEPIHSNFETVLRVGLLPIHAKIRGESVDVSGISGNPGNTSIPMDAWDNIRRYDMHLGTKWDRPADSVNQPMFNGSRINAFDYAAEVEEGFTAVCSSMVDHREELVGQAGILQRFHGDEVRMVLRPSRLYEQLLYYSFHPDSLGNGLHRSRLISRLWQDAEQWPQCARIVSAEETDLENGDIPRFSSCPDLPHIWTSTGECIPNVLAEAGIDSVRRRIQTWSKDQLKRQVYYIRTSLAALSAASRKRTS